MAKKNRKRQTTQYFSFDRLEQFRCTYMWAIGERSNGKTFDCKKHGINVAKNGRQFVLLKRWHSQITRPKMQRFFEDIDDYAIQTLGETVQYSTENGFYIGDEDNKKTLGYAVALEDMYDNKGGVYDKVDEIYFDEVIETRYLQDEIKYFLNTISTIVRKRPNIKIYMTSNTVSRFCPYFKLFGIDITKLHQGDIAVTHHKNGASVAIEYCKSLVQELGEIKKDRYIGFDNNETVNMILYGEWDTNSVNIKSIDGIGWSCKNRRLVYAYVTAIGEVYEMSIHLTKNPIAFVRNLNNSDGKVKEYIKYNFTLDNSIILTNKNGIVPSYGRVNKFVDDDTRERLEFLHQCIIAKRIVFDTPKTGTEFLHAFSNIYK